jgi:hypothetical protein
VTSAVFPERSKSKGEVTSSSSRSAAAATAVELVLEYLRILLVRTTINAGLSSESAGE